ncbi:MAG: hypothetical protein H0V81_00440 [Solirubrobacterales bacterium]|nr:hypothetical protein [Solirubrobacterales bacterium]
MTLGDRVAVMRAGTIQQVDTPKELYERPRNLFVAGFIGSPSMNFFPADLGDGKVRLPFGEVPVPAALKGVKAEHVIAGVRPESFEWADLAPEHHDGESFVFEVEIDLVESMGSELYVYFDYEGEGATSDELAEIAADAGLADVPGGGGRVVARLSPDAQVKAGEKTKLWLDVERLHLFDAKDGRRLTGEEGSGEREVSAPDAAAR